VRARKVMECCRNELIVSRCRGAGGFKRHRTQEEGEAGVGAESQLRPLDLPGNLMFSRVVKGHYLRQRRERLLHASHQPRRHLSFVPNERAERLDLMVASRSPAEPSACAAVEPRMYAGTTDRSPAGEKAACLARLDLTPHSRSVHSVPKRMAATAAAGLSK
jgi:hypothetical protein